MSDDSGTARAQPGHDEIYCTSCGAVIKERAELCPECGVRNAPAGTGPGTKDRTTAAILALLLGGLGAHHFYLENTARAILYLVFFWTFIPGIVAFVEGIIYLTKTDAEFQAQYVDGSTQRPAHSHAEMVYCSACGAQHAAEAERCPECGVPNPAGNRHDTTASGGATHDPADYDTTVGPDWYYGVIAPTVLTIPALAVFIAGTPDGAVSGLAALALLASVVIPIVALYFDRQYVRANSTWHPSALWLVGLFFLYPLNIALAGVYLYRRHETLGEP